MLLQQDAREFVIDLSDVEYEYMGSWCLGFLADVGMKANMESKRLMLVASGAAAKTMKETGGLGPVDRIRGPRLTACAIPAPRAQERVG